MSTEGTIKFPVTTNLPDDPAYVVSTDELLGTLVVDGGTDGEFLVRDSVQPSGFGWQRGVGSVHPVLYYQFSQTTTPGPSGSQIRFNAFPYTDVTEIQVRDQTVDGFDARTLLLLTAIGSIIYVQDKDDATRFASFTTIGVPSGATDYVILPVVYRSEGSTLLAQQVAVYIVSQPSSGGGGSTDPLTVSTIQGGTEIGSTLTLKPTTANGDDTSEVRIKVGNNGGADAIRFQKDYSLIPHDRWIYGLHLNGVTPRCGIRYSSTAYAPLGIGDHMEIGCNFDQPVTGQDYNVLWTNSLAALQFVYVGCHPGRPMDGVKFGGIGAAADRGHLFMQTDGVLTMTDGPQTGFSRVQFGGQTASFPALKRNGVALETKLANDSAYAQHTAKQIAIVDGVSEPATQAGLATLYVEAGALKIKFSDGTVKTVTLT